MIIKLLSAISLLIVLCALAFAQAPSAAKSDEEAAAKKAREAKAVSLLQQVIEDTGLLKSVENRIRVQAIAADLLWSRNEKRARSLLDEAMSSFASFVASDAGISCPDCYAGFQTAMQLRGELIQVASRHDPKLALKFLRSSRLAAPGRSQMGQYLTATESQQEQSIAAGLASSDPKLAEQIAEDSIKTGLSYNVINVLSELQSKDSESAAKLAALVLDRIQSENLADTTIFSVASGLIGLALPNVQQESQTDGQTSGSSDQQTSASDGQGTGSNGSQPMIKPSDLQDLARKMVALGLNPPANADNPNESANIYNAIMNNIQPMLPQLTKLVPEQASALNEKIAAFKDSVDPSQRAWAEIQPLMQTGSVSVMLDAAAKVPEGMRLTVFQQAAFKADADGDPSQARQILNDKIPDTVQRDQMIAQLDRQEFYKASSESKVQEARAALSRISSPDERASLVLQLSAQLLQKGDKKTVLQLIDEASGLLPAKAKNYNQLGIQLQIAQAYIAVDPSRSISLLTAIANHLNALIAAAAVLEGFDVQNAFRDDELKLQPNASIASMFVQYAGQLSRLAEVDFDNAAAAAGALDRPETRMFARLTIARGILAGQQSVSNQFNFGGGFGPGYMRNNLVIID